MVCCVLACPCLVPDDDRFWRQGLAVARPQDGVRGPWAPRQGDCPCSVPGGRQGQDVPSGGMQEDMAGGCDMPTVFAMMQGMKSLTATDLSIAIMCRVQQPHAAASQTPCSTS